MIISRDYITSALVLDKFILFTQSIDICHISMDTYSNVDVTLPISGVKHATKLDWSSTRHTFYWVDSNLGTINEATLEVRLSTPK